METVEEFRERAKKTVGDFEVIDPPDKTFSLAVQMCEVFEVPAHCCSKLRPPGVTNFGFVLIGHPGIETQHPIWVAGHETWHVLQRRFESRIMRFQASTLQKLKPEAIEARRDIENDVPGRRLRALLGKTYDAPLASHQTIVNEVFADVFANVWCDVEFWMAVQSAVHHSDVGFIDLAIEQLRDLKIPPYRDWYLTKQEFMPELVEIAIEWLGVSARLSTPEGHTNG